jgi:hypothetical protein
MKGRREKCKQLPRLDDGFMVGQLIARRAPWIVENLVLTWVKPLERLLLLPVDRLQQHDRSSRIGIKLQLPITPQGSGDRPPQWTNGWCRKKDECCRISRRETLDVWVGPWPRQGFVVDEGDESIETAGRQGRWTMGWPMSSGR